LSYLNGKLSGLDSERILEFLEPVYRYHLARCENYLEAQNLTVQTLSTAMKWINTHRSGHDSLKTWVMKIAHDRQSIGGRHSTMAVKRSGGASSATSPSPSSAYEPLPPEQTEILLRDRMAHLSNSWKSLPAMQADALALHYFGSLSLPEVGAILHKPEAKVRTLVARETAFETELLELSSSIHPGKDLLSRVKDELSQPGERQKDWRPPYSAWHRFLRMGARLGQMGLLVGVLVFGFYIIQRQSLSPSDITATPASTSLTGAIATWEPGRANQTPTPVDNPGDLVPPAAGVCQQFQATLADMVDQQDVTVSNAAFNDPSQASSTQPGSGTKGVGCLLETMVINWDLHSAWATFDSVSELLFSKNFDQVGDAGYPGYGDKNYFDPGCYGLGRTFTNLDSRAILTVSWCLPAQTIAGTGTPIPTNTSLNMALDLGGGNPLTIEIRPYILKLVLASNDLGSFLNNFFSQWSAGKQPLTIYLAPSLLKHFPNLRALDRLAGINPLLDPKVNFSWKVIDNSGANLRILVQVSESTGQATPVNLKAEFQMLLTHDSNTWTIHDLGKTVQFSS
jgi:DNA-directed RNA polymerase specialized sigma24 family protein